MKKMLLFAAALAVPVMVHAQMTVRPKILTAPPTATPPTVAPDWFKEAAQMKARISQLEGQLNQTRQELAGFKQEYASHTHAGCRATMVQDSSGGKSLIIKWHACDRVATGAPIQAAPFSSLD